MSAPIVTPNIPIPAEKPAEKMTQTEILEAANAIRAAIPATPTAPTQAADDVATAAAGTGAPSPVAPAVAVVALPEGFSEYELRPDGTLHTKLVTGEVFDGQPLEVAQKIGASKVATNTSYKETKTLLEDVQKRINAGATTEAAAVAAAAANPEAAATLSGMSPEQFSNLYYESLNDPGKATVMAAARELGFDSVEEFKETVQQMRQTSETAQANMVAQEFARACPDFPFTPEARDALYGVMAKAGISESLEGLEAAHALCLKKKLYEPRPAGPTQTTGPTQPTPPPMTPRSSSTVVNPDINKMTTAQIEEMARQVRHGG